MLNKELSSGCHKVSVVEHMLFNVPAARMKALCSAVHQKSIASPIWAVSRSISDLVTFSSATPALRTIAPRFKYSAEEPSW